MSAGRRALAALGAAGLLLLAHEPVALWPLAPVAATPLFVLARARPRPVLDAICAYLGGLAFFGIGCSWLRETAALNWLAVTVLEALSWPLLLVTERALRRRLPDRLAVWAGACAFAGVEALRSHVPFNGFPWLPLAAALAPDPPSIQAASWIGSSGLSFLLAASSAWLAGSESLRMAGRRGAALAVGWAGVHFAGLPWARAAEEDGRPGPLLLLVQANVPQSLKNRLALEEIWRKQRDATRSALEAVPNPDAVVWAETMWIFGLPADPGDGSRDRQARELVARECGIPDRTAFLAGTLLVEPSAEGERLYNGFVALASDGRRTGEYRKTLLVPGGEFLPLRALVPEGILAWLERSVGMLPDLVPGRGPALVTIPSAGGRAFRAAVTICYENAYSGYHAACGRLDPDFLLNVSNEGWFGTSHEFDQMDALSRLRAVETRRALVRSTNTGITALYLPSGRRARVLRGPSGADRNVAGHLAVRVPIHTGRTLFVRCGDWIGFGSLALAALGTLLEALARARRYFRRGVG